MKTWNDWSDLEINRKVAEVLGKKVVQHSMMFEGKVWVIEGDNGIERLPDYCNDVVHAWPIMIKHHISIDLCSPTRWLVYGVDVPMDNRHYAYSGKIHTFDKNPLRAAMIVFLMMNGVEYFGE